MRKSFSVTTYVRVCVFFAYVFSSEIQLENVDMPAYDFLFLSNL